MEYLGDKLEVLKVLSHPVRIQILQELSVGVKCVSDFKQFLGISQPNVSQHLSLMRNLGVINYYMDGRLRCYYIVDSMVPDLLKLLNKDHSKPVRPPACCPVTKKGKYPSKKVCT